MNTYADKEQEHKSQSVANSVSQKKSFGDSIFQFVDNRPEAIAQRKLQKMANNHSARQQDTIQRKFVYTSKEGAFMEFYDNSSLQKDPVAIELFKKNKGNNTPNEIVEKLKDTSKRFDLRKKDLPEWQEPVEEEDVGESKKLMSGEQKKIELGFKQTSFEDGGGLPDGNKQAFLAAKAHGGTWCAAKYDGQDWVVGQSGGGMCAEGQALQKLLSGYPQEQRKTMKKAKVHFSQAYVGNESSTPGGVAVCHSCQNNFSGANFSLACHDKSKDNNTKAPESWSDLA